MDFRRTSIRLRAIRLFSSSIRQGALKLIKISLERIPPSTHPLPWKNDFPARFNLNQFLLQVGSRRFPELRRFQNACPKLAENTSKSALKAKIAVYQNPHPHPYLQLAPTFCSQNLLRSSCVSPCSPTNPDDRTKGQRNNKYKRCMLLLRTRSERPPTPERRRTSVSSLISGSIRPSASPLGNLEPGWVSILSDGGLE